LKDAVVGGASQIVSPATKVTTLFGGVEFAKQLVVPHFGCRLASVELLPLLPPESTQMA
jgi:hypothetical protein